MYYTLRSEVEGRMQSWSAPLCAALASALQAYTTLLAAATANISGSSITSANTNKTPLHTVVGTTSTGATITSATGASDNGLGVTFSISNGTSGGNGGSGSSSVVGGKRSLYDTTSTQYGSGKYAAFTYDADATTSGITDSHTLTNSTNTSTTPHSNHYTIKISPKRADKENTDVKYNKYNIHSTLPKLHDYITYYPIIHATATDTTKSTRYIRMDSCVHKAASVCMYEISQLGVYGVE